MFVYRILKSTTLITETQLAQLASEGWRLVQIVHNPNDNQFYFYLERTQESIGLMNPLRNTA